VHQTFTRSGLTSRPAARLAVVGVLLLVGLGVAVRAQEPIDEAIRIVPLARDGRLLVSFSVADGYTEAVREAIHSGLRTTFTYEVELRLAVPAWIDRTIAATTITNTVEYDNLTRQHAIVRTIDGRTIRDELTEDEALVRALMTTLEQEPLFDTATLEPSREYYVRVQAAAVRPRNAPFLWPWGGSGSAGQATFTFLP
jgi:hypothetical protein